MSEASNQFGYWALYGTSKEEVEWYLEATSDFILREGEPQTLRLSRDPVDTSTITRHGRVEYTDSSIVVYDPSADEFKTLARIGMKRATSKGMSGIDSWVGNVLPCKALTTERK